MEKFNNLKGVAAPFNFMNVDTDKIIPKQFLKTIKRTGLGKHLFDEMRLQVIILAVVQAVSMPLGLCQTLVLSVLFLLPLLIFSIIILLKMVSCL